MHKNQQKSAFFSEKSFKNHQKSSKIEKKIRGVYLKSKKGKPKQTSPRLSIPPAGGTGMPPREPAANAALGSTGSPLIRIGFGRFFLQGKFRRF